MSTKKPSFFFALIARVFNPCYASGCQRKSFRYRIKENFETWPKSLITILSELCHFLWWPNFYFCAKPGWKLGVWKFVVHQKCHNSESIVITDLGQVSKFSLVQYLNLFLWHPKDLVSRKNVLGETKFFLKNGQVFFVTL